MSVNDRVHTWRDEKTTTCCWRVWVMMRSSKCADTFKWPWMLATIPVLVEPAVTATAAEKAISCCGTTMSLILPYHTHVWRLERFEIENSIIINEVMMVPRNYLYLAKLRQNAVYSVSQKIPPWDYLNFFLFFHKRLRIFNRFFTHPLYVLIYARLQIFYAIISNFDKVMPY